MSQDRDSLGERLVGDGSEGSPGGTQLNNSSPPISPPKNQVGAIAGPRMPSPPLMLKIGAVKVRLVGDGSEGSPGGTRYIIVRHVYLRLKIMWRYILYDVYVYNISIDRFIGLYAYICVYVFP